MKLLDSYVFLERLRELIYELLEYRIGLRRMTVRLYPSEGAHR